MYVDRYVSIPERISTALITVQISKETQGFQLSTIGRSITKGARPVQLRSDFRCPTDLSAAG
jgi:hypothetical protein